MPKQRSSLISRIHQPCNTTTAWPLSYSTLVVVCHSYLLYQAIRRYLVYKTVWPDQGVYHLSLICVSALILPLIMMASIVKLGSYTNDGYRVGMNMIKKELADTTHPFLDRLYKGSAPLAQILHVIAAYLILIPNVFTISYGKSRQQLTDDSKMLKDFIGSGTIRIKIRPDTNSTHATSSSDYVTLPSTDLEVVNLMLALFIYSIRMISTFWDSNSHFTIAFGVQSLLSNGIHLLSYLGFSYLFVEISRGDNPKAQYLLSKASLCILYLIGNCLLFLSSWCVFHFGYGLILDKMDNYLRNLGYHRRHRYKVYACTPYIPHITALVLILLYVACNVPIMYDYVTVYTESRSHILVIHLTASVLYMLFWIILWFCFTLKQKWEFKINEPLLKRHAILQNQQGFFIEEVCLPDKINGNVSQDIAAISSEDNLSNSTTSTVTTSASHNANGILNNNRQNRQKKKSADQKVKFQAATKIVIETNLDSDLDTIPESDAEQADSAMFSGSGDSNNSNDSNAPNINYTNGVNNYQQKQIVLDPRNITLTPSQSEKMWSSTGDLNNSRLSHYNRMQSVLSDSGHQPLVQGHTSRSWTRPLRGSNHEAFNQDYMSSAV